MKIALYFLIEKYLMKVDILWYSQWTSGEPGGEGGRADTESDEEKISEGGDGDGDGDGDRDDHRDDGDDWEMCLNITFDTNRCRERETSCCLWKRMDCSQLSQEFRQNKYEKESHDHYTALSVISHGFHYCVLF